MVFYTFSLPFRKYIDHLQVEIAADPSLERPHIPVPHAFLNVRKI
ncbi:MAG TPA: hypothetical protein PKN85_08800 [Syntrophorhabdaceae bacterium]|nr:hypothetical protein [Syntrophorhabdaceae bacterium]